MEYGLLSLIPAAVTIAVALSTKRVALALLCGIVGGAFVFTHGHLGQGFLAIGEYLLVSFTDLERLKIVLFIMLIGGMLEIIAASGAYNEFAASLSKKLNTPRKSRLATWGLSMCMFFDDYANVLISGASMRAVNARNGVSPAKLAYMVDVVAVMASVMIISTWASYEGSVMMDAAENIGKAGSITTFFIASLPYHMYTYLAIFLVFVVALTGKWFGYAMDKENHLGDMEAEERNPKAKLTHVLVPIITLVGFAIIALFASGSFILWQQGKPITLIEILGTAPSVEILIISTLLSTGLAVFLLHKDRVIETKRLPKTFFTGLKGMVGVSLVIIFATGLSEVSTDLGTGAYVAEVFSGFITPQVLPALIFVLSMLITVATGFSWSSMAIVMPIAFQMAVTNGVPEFIPVISAAVITGAVSGEHMIPYSEKAVMTSAACKITPVYHVKTHILQALLAFGAAVVGYLLIGHGWQTIWAYLVAIGVLLIIHFAFARENKVKFFLSKVE